jgi:hypothetical protein
VVPVEPIAVRRSAISFPEPDEGLIADDRPVLLLDDPRPPVRAVIGEFTAMRALIDRNRLIFGIPLEGAAIAIGVNGSTCVGFGHRKRSAIQILRLSHCR